VVRGVLVFMFSVLSTLVSLWKPSRVDGAFVY